MTLNLAPFKTLVREHCGLLFEGGGEDKLAAAVRERMADVGSADAAAYYAHLNAGADEFQEFVNLLTINETYFFREPEQIHLLVERLAPRLLAHRGERLPIRILSAGCSSGEEPYSLAMALHQKYGESVSRLFSFCGGDIDSTVLAKARLARYTEFSFRGVPADVRDRYFDKSGWAYVLKESMRERVEFRELNLLAKSFPPELRDFDVIFFRNVSIYFDAQTRKRIQQHLSSMLRDDGILMIGTAETLANDLGVLPLVEEDGLFYFVKGQPPLAEAAPVRQAKLFELPPPPVVDAVFAWPPPAAVVPTSSPDVATLQLPFAAALPPASLEDAIRLTREMRYDEALPIIGQRLAADANDTAALLLKAHIQLNRKDFAAAETAAARVLETEPWSVDAFLLLGLAAKWRNQAEEAIRRFKQAVYARHECWPAHYYLADLYRGTAMPDLARREYRIVLQLLSAAAPDSGVRVIPLGLPAGEIRFLCEHQLAKLDGLGKPVASR